MTQTEMNMLAAAGLSPTGGAFDYRSLLEPAADTTAGGIAAGNPPKSGYGAYGGIPQLPPYTVDTTTVTGADLWGQLKAAGGPGVAQNLQRGVGVIGDYMMGRVPTDVQSLLGSTAAGIGSGAMGMGANAPGTDLAYLRMLGLTSLDMQNKGLAAQNQLFTSWPYQQGSTTTEKKDLSGLQAVYNAMPDPALAAQESLNAIAAGMGRGGYGSSGGLRIPTASDVRPTDMSWFYKQPGSGGGSAPSLSGGWNLPGSTYDPYAPGEPFEGDISDPNSAWWQDYGGTGNLGDMGFGGWYDTGSSWDDWSDYEGDYGWI